MWRTCTADLCVTHVCALPNTVPHTTHCLGSFLKHGSQIMCPHTNIMHAPACHSTRRRETHVRVQHAHQLFEADRTRDITHLCARTSV
jgi:hypothetical protein